MSTNLLSLRIFIYLVINLLTYSISASTAAAHSLTASAHHNPTFSAHNTSTPTAHNNFTATTHYSFTGHMLNDFYQFYCTKQLAMRMVGVGVAGHMANSNLDPHFRSHWQDHWRSNFTDKVSNTIDSYGEIASYPVAVPIYLSILLITGHTLNHKPQTPLQNFANHALRTLIVGVPEQVLLSHLLGSGRPESGNHQWLWFLSHRAVSGHAFYGAIPLLVLAQQQSENWLKGAFYLFSIFPGLARINNDKHYLSQVGLGWWLAYNASQAVVCTDIVSKKSKNTALQILPLESGIFLGMTKKF